MLAECGTIKTLILEFNQIDDQCVDALGNYLRSNRHIQTLNLTDNRISINGIKALGEYLQGNRTLRHLVLFKGNIMQGSPSAPIYADLMKMSRIESLTSTSIEPYQTKVIAIPAWKNIIRNCEICSISILSRDLTDDDLIEFADFIKSPENVNKIESITIESGEITAKGLCALFDSLHEANFLHSLFLPRDKVDDSCVFALSHLIYANESLKKLVYNSSTRTNGLSMKGFEVLAEKLVGNVSLKEFGLNIKVENGLSYFEIFKELATKTGIEVLNIPTGVISREERRKIREYLEIPVEAREIPILSTTKSAAKSQRT